MVFCCAWDSTLDPEEAVQRAEASSKARAYSGERRLVKTDGNALMDALDMEENEETDALIPPSVPSCDTMVAVTVPAGIAAGDTIAVKSPQGNRTVSAKVPQGLSPGQTFMVRFPDREPASPAQPIPTTTTTKRPENQHVPAFAQSLDDFMVKTPVDGTHGLDPSPSKTVPLSPIGKHASEEESRQDELESRGFSDSPDPPQFASPSASATTPISPVPVPQQKFLLVNIPPGVLPGQTLHVEVPGENRTLAATVPSGVSSFRVAYTPQVPEHLLSPPSTRSSQHKHESSSVSSSLGQKLLLVQVPPGTGPGATLHVAVPDEPGRILAAQVPAGNIKQFHVAYEPRVFRQQGIQAGFMPPANPYSYSQGQQQNQRYMGPSYHSSNNNNARMSRNSNFENRDTGNFFLPAVGAAALGTAAFATYEHFQHQENYQDSGYGDAGFDMGGAGGDFAF